MKIERFHKGRILSPGRAKSGHLLVVLGRNQVRFIHRLVLETFVCPRPSEMECRHKDGRHENNHLCNLIWGTRAENVADMFKHGVHRWQRRVK